MVSVSEYVRWWRMRGARVGHLADADVPGGERRIVWDPLPGELAAATPAPEQAELF